MQKMILTWAGAKLVFIGPEAEIIISMIISIIISLIITIVIIIVITIVIIIVITLIIINVNLALWHLSSSYF